MVRRDPLAPGGDHGPLQDPLRILPEGALLQGGDEGAKVDGRRIDGILGPGVAYEPAGIEPLCYPHGVGCGESDAAGGGDEGGGVEGGGGPVGPRLLLYGEDRRLFAEALEYRPRQVAVPDPPLLVLDGKVLIEVGADLPVGLGLEGLDLLLPVDDEGEGRRLDPPHR